jgi:hypothetical protein
VCVFQGALSRKFVMWSVFKIDKRVGELGRTISLDFEGLPIANLGQLRDVSYR